MADEEKSSESPETPAQRRVRAIKAYHAAETAEAKADVVKQFPVLKEIFSEANHHTS